MIIDLLASGTALVCFFKAVQWFWTKDKIIGWLYIFIVLCFGSVPVLRYFGY